MALLRSLGVDLSGDKAPAPGTYPAEISYISDLEEKPALKFKDSDPDKINLQCRVSYRFDGFPFDPDIDTKDWEGEEVSDYYVFIKKQMKDVKHPDGSITQEVEKVFDSYLDERSGSYKLLKALMGRAPTREDEINLEEFVGTKVDIVLAVKDNGWPKITSVSRRRAARRAAAPAPAPKPIPADDDLTGTAFADDDED